MCVCVHVCVFVQWVMANGGDQFGLADRPDSDCLDSPKESKQENLSFTLKSAAASPQTASSQQVAASAADPDVNIKYLSLLTAAYSVEHRFEFNMQNVDAYGAFRTCLILHFNNFY